MIHINDNLQNLFDSLISLLSVNTEHRYVQELLMYYPLHEITYGTSATSEGQNSGTKAHILDIYETRAGLETDLRPDNNFVTGYDQLLPALRESNLTHICISNISTDVGTYIVFSNNSYSDFIGILKSKRTLSEERNGQKEFNSKLPRVNYDYRAHEHVFINGRLTTPVMVDFKPEYQPYFKQLNHEWISKYFIIEDSDNKVLDKPQEEIINKGGFILMALYDNQFVGTVAMINLGNHKYELAKMAVTPSAQGLGIGWRMAQQAIYKAWCQNAETIYLESNSKLTPAISLYRKLGFIETELQPTPYQRCNIQMELKLR